MPPLDPIQNAPGTFDDKMIVVDASPSGGHPGNAIPMLLDLADKPMFLHDGSVRTLNEAEPSRAGDVNARETLSQAVKGVFVCRDLFRPGCDDRPRP